MKKRRGEEAERLRPHKGNGVIEALGPLSLSSHSTARAGYGDDCRYRHYDPVENSLEAATSFQGPMQSLSLTR